jgi:hypothetical protein
LNAAEALVHLRSNRTATGGITVQGAIDAAFVDMRTRTKKPSVTTIADREAVLVKLAETKSEVLATDVAVWHDQEVIGLVDELTGMVADTPHASSLQPEREWSDHRIRRLMELMSAAWKIQTRAGLVPDNPWVRNRPPKPPKLPIDVPTANWTHHSFAQ